MKKKIKTILIGLGNIGLEYDLNKKKNYLTHAKTIFYNNSLNFLLGIDKDKKKLEKFKKKYKINTAPKINKFVRDQKPELAIISVNTKYLFSVFFEVIKIKSIKYIILEKPGADNYTNLKKIYYFSKKNKIKLLISYNRSYFKNFLNKFKFLKKTNNFKIIFNYSRGLFNNASHFLNLIFHFLGKPKKIIITNYGKKIKEDINPDVILKFKNGLIYLLSNQNKYILNKLLLISENKTIFSNNNFLKLIISKPNKKSLIKSSKLLSKQKTYTIHQNYYQKNSLDLFLKNMKSKKNQKNFNIANLKTLEVLDKIKNKRISKL